MSYASYMRGNRGLKPEGPIKLILLPGALIVLTGYYLVLLPLLMGLLMGLPMYAYEYYIKTKKEKEETWFDTFIYVCAMLFGIVWFIFLFVIYLKIFHWIKLWYITKYY